MHRRIEGPHPVGNIFGSNGLRIKGQGSNELSLVQCVSDGNANARVLQIRSRAIQLNARVTVDVDPNDRHVRHGPKRLVRLLGCLKHIINRVGSQEVDRRLFVWDDLDIYAIQARPAQEKVVVASQSNVIATGPLHELKRTVANAGPAVERDLIEIRIARQHVLRRKHIRLIAFGEKGVYKRREPALEVNHGRVNVGRVYA
jgi:hypothetical protein